jgi:uncharacterized protein YjiS (DUF1127 family)
MTNLYDPSSGEDCRNEEGDAPAIAGLPPVWRWLRALSSLRLLPVSWLKPSHKRRRTLQLHRMNDYLLKDLGLVRVEDEDVERLRALMFRSQDENP